VLAACRRLLSSLASLLPLSLEHAERVEDARAARAEDGVARYERHVLGKRAKANGEHVGIDGPLFPRSSRGGGGGGGGGGGRLQLRR